MEGTSCSTTVRGLGLADPSLSGPASSLEPLRDDDRSLKRLDFLSE